MLYKALLRLVIEKIYIFFNPDFKHKRNKAEHLQKKKNTYTGFGNCQGKKDKRKPVLAERVFIQSEIHRTHFFSSLNAKTTFFRKVAFLQLALSCSKTDLKHTHAHTHTELDMLSLGLSVGMSFSHL